MRLTEQVLGRAIDGRSEGTPLTVPLGSIADAAAVWRAEIEPKPLAEAGPSEFRAIAGFSRGGGQSLFTGFGNLDKFGWIGSYSAYLTPAVVDARLPGLMSDPESTDGKLKLLWLGVGKQDFLYKDACAFEEYLTAKGIRHSSRTTDGGHTWMNARAYLTETLQLFFR